MKSFQLAAKNHVEGEDVEEERILEFTLGKEEFQSKLATSGQISLMFASLGMGEVAGISGIYKFLRGVLVGNGYKRLTGMVERGEIEFDLLFGGDGLNDMTIVEWIIEESGDRPTQSPAGSSGSQSNGGKRSTGRSPGKGSTHSD